MSKVLVVPQSVLRNPRALQDLSLEEAAPIIRALCATDEIRLAVSRASHSRESAALLLLVVQHVSPEESGEEALLPLCRIIKRGHAISLAGVQGFADYFWGRAVRMEVTKSNYAQAYNLILRACHGFTSVVVREGEPPRPGSVRQLAATKEALGRMVDELCRALNRARHTLDGDLDGAAWDYQTQHPGGVSGKSYIGYVPSYDTLGLPLAHALGCIRSSGELDTMGKQLVALARHFAGPKS